MAIAETRRQPQNEVRTSEAHAPAPGQSSRLTKDPTWWAKNGGSHRSWSNGSFKCLSAMELYTTSFDHGSHRHLRPRAYKSCVPLGAEGYVGLKVDPS